MFRRWSRGIWKVNTKRHRVPYWEIIMGRMTIENTTDCRNDGVDMYPSDLERVKLKGEKLAYLKNHTVLVALILTCLIVYDTAVIKGMGWSSFFSDVEYGLLPFATVVFVIAMRVGTTDIKALRLLLDVIGSSDNPEGDINKPRYDIELEKPISNIKLRRIDRDFNEQYKFSCALCVLYVIFAYVWVLGAVNTYVAHSQIVALAVFSIPISFGVLMIKSMFLPIDSMKKLSKEGSNSDVFRVEVNSYNIAWLMISVGIGSSVSLFLIVLNTHF